MRKLKLFFACLLMAVLSIGQVWGDSDSKTIKYSDKNISNGTSVNNTSYDLGDYFEVTVTKNEAATEPTYYDSGSAVRCYANKGTSNGNIITVSRKSAGDAVNAYITSVTYTGSHSQKGTTSFTYSGTTTSTTAISATYAESSHVTTASATLKETGNSKNGQFYLTDVTVEYVYTPAATSHTLSYAVSPSATGSVTLSSTSVVEGSTATATATPATHYVFSNWSISGAGASLSSTTTNPTTVTMGTTNATVTANFTLAPKASITLSEAGATTTDATTYYVGDEYTLPSTTTASCGTKVLVGWSTSEVAETNTKPTVNYYEKGAKVTLAASQTFYAVFATESEAPAPTAYTAGDVGTFVLAANVSGTWYALPTNPTVSSGKIAGEEITVSTSATSVKYVTSTNASGYAWTIANATNGQTISDGTKYIYHSNGGASGTNLTYGNGTSYTWNIASETGGLTFQAMNGSTTNDRGMLVSGTQFGGYSLGNEGNSGYSRIQVLPISADKIYSAYTTNCAAPACEKKVTISAGAKPDHGSFILDKTGDQLTCDDAVNVIVTPTADEHYHVATVSTTTGETGTNNGDGTWTITYIQETNKESTINVTFAEDTKYVVTWNVSGNEDTKTNVYAGEKPVFPATPAACDVTSTSFIGWATATWPGKLDDIAGKTVYTSANSMPVVDAAVTYYAVFAKSNGASAFDGEHGGTFKIYAQVGEDKVYAGSYSSSKYGRTTDAADATDFVIAAVDDAFTIKDGTKYLTYSGSSTNFGKSDDPYYWNIKAGSATGSWHITSVNTSARGFIYRANSYNVFGAYGSGNVDDTEYFDVEIGTAPTYEDYITTCCTKYNISIDGDIEHGTASADLAQACEGATVTITLTPNGGYYLESWSVNGTEQNIAANTFTMPAEAVIVSAVFEQMPSYAIDLSGITLATASSNPSGEALAGATVTLSYSDLASGYTFLNWIVEGATSGDLIAVDNNDQFTMPNEAVTVTANIVQNVTVTFHVGATTYGEPAETYPGGKISLPAVNPSTSFDVTNYPNFIGWSATDFGAVTSAPALVTGDEEINSSTDYYAVFANACTAETSNYKKIAFTSSLDAGNYLLVAVGSTVAKAMKAEIPSNKYNTTSKTVTVGEGDVINNPAAALIWALSKSGDNVKLKNGDNWAQIYNDGNGHTNLILTTTDANNTYAVSQNGSTDAYVFTTTSSVGTNNQIEYYNNEFKPYGSQNADYPIYLFKQVLAPTKWATRLIVAEVTVSFNDNVAEEEITVPGNQVVDSGDDLDLSGFTPGARAGYQFSGWSLTTDGVVVASLSNITENTPLYAIWEANPNCTIHFSVRGTVKAGMDVTQQQGLAFTAFASKEIANEDKVDGFNFIGWASAEQLTETTAAITPMTTYTPTVEATTSEVTVYAIYKRVEAGDDVTDEITATNLPATGTSYESFTDRGFNPNSTARYAGATAKGNSAIQINNNNNPYKGIVVTTSGGIAKNVVVEWNTNTTDERTLSIYGKDSEYSGAGDLFSNATQGTSLGSIVCGTSTELTISGSYEYIGIRSASGAMYLDKISITWTPMTSYYTTDPKQRWTVTYELNGGTGTTPTQDAVIATTVITLDDATGLTAPAGQEFDGWLCDIDAIKYAANAEYTMTAAATTFTAQWKQITYAVTYVSAHGSAPDVENAASVTLVELTEAGWTHTGWVANVDVEVDDATVTAGTPIANGKVVVLSAATEFTAQWIEDAPTPVYEIVRSGLEAGRHYTICLKKKIIAVKGATFWNLNKRDEGATVAYLEEASLPFPAGTPYIFQATNDNEGKLEVVYEGGDVENPVTNGALRGRFTDLDQAGIDDAATAESSDIYMLKNNELRQANGRSGNTMKAYKAYIVYGDLTPVSTSPLPAPGKRVKSMPMEPQVTTDIDNVQGDNVQCTKVLIDGQMYILRGEKLYDATGRLVK